MAINVSGGEKQGLLCKGFKALWDKLTVNRSLIVKTPHHSDYRNFYVHNVLV